MANVVLLDKDGKEKIHSTGRGIRLFSEDGTAQDFFPNKSEEITVELDFSEGDMIVESSEDSLIEKVTIIKPADLVPEKIAEGIEIAGVVGNFKGSSGGINVEGDLLDTSVYHIDIENKEITLYGILYDRLPPASILGPQINIPNNLGEFDVVICSGGVG